MPTSPMARQQLGQKLRRLREDAGSTVADAAARLQCSEAKISRVETGRTSIRHAELAMLLDFYRVDPETADAVLDFHKSSSGRPWWATYRPLWPHLIELEQRAVSVRSYCAGALPGLVQTRAYATGSIRAHTPDLTDDELARQVDLRLRRRDRLTDSPALTAWWVVDEHVLHRPFCSPGDMADQMRELLKINEQHPTVTLQVLPTDAPCPPCARGSFSLFTMADGCQVVCTEAGLTDVVSDDCRQIADGRLRLERLLADALSPAASIKVVEAMIEKWDKEDG